MLLYQIRPRVFRFDSDQSVVISFPACVEIRFHLKPLQPFGMTAGGGRTAVRSVPARARFNANSGIHTIESQEPLKPLEVTAEDPARVLSLTGNVLSITETFDSLERLRETVESIHFGIPMLLNVVFADPPFVERVEGVLGGRSFRWELSHWEVECGITTQELQETKVTQAWKRMSLFGEGKRRRLLAALHYFHMACRLDRSGETIGEFLPEILLNLAKTLEALFPPGGECGSMDSARSGLRELGYSDEEIEKRYVPAIALRNHVGVGHVTIALFTSDQLKVLHTYAEQAETAFRSLLNNIIEKIESGDYEIPDYQLQSPPASILRVVDRLRASQS